MSPNVEMQTVFVAFDLTLPIPLRTYRAERSRGTDARPRFNRGWWSKPPGASRRCSVRNAAKRVHGSGRDSLYDATRHLNLSYWQYTCINRATVGGCRIDRTSVRYPGVAIGAAIRLRLTCVDGRVSAIGRIAACNE